MKNIFPYNQLYFVGIGGIGMSALARFFRAQGFPVAGYDRVESPLTKSLVKEGIPVHYTDDIEKIPALYRNPDQKEKTLVVFTPAIPGNHSELTFFRNSGYNVIKRSALLGLVSEQSRSIAVAGTHGKTSISTLTAHILKISGLDAASFLGGISNNYQTNYLAGEGEWIVLEADEFDRSFLTLHPHIALVSAIDPDHLDIYGTPEKMYEAFRQFVAQVRPGGSIVVKNNLSLSPADNKNTSWFTYGMSREADFFPTGIQEKNGYFTFGIQTPDRHIADIRLGVPGLVNVENAVAAVAVCLLAGAGVDDIRKALLVYKGVKRRFDIRVAGERYVYIDDYAHHPREISTTLSSLRKMFPEREITGVFQPHLYSRTRDFADGFAESLDRFDRLILLDIYPAREEPIPGVTSQIIFSKMKLEKKYLLHKENLIDFIRRDPPPVLVTMGAGDIDRLVVPLENIYRKLNYEG